MISCLKGYQDLILYNSMSFFFLDVGRHYVEVIPKAQNDFKQTAPRFVVLLHYLLAVNLGKYLFPVLIYNPHLSSYANGNNMIRSSNTKLLFLVKNDCILSSSYDATR